jgi:glycosyltransferase involved in cell wall biosynthesis
VLDVSNPTAAASPGARLGSDQPLVSIGLPVFNGAHFLSASLESLLGQTYRNIELLVSDNASTDSTGEICRRYAAVDARLRYSRLPSNIGGVPNHNHVFSQAAGAYFMWASHDDVWSTSYIEQCVARLSEDPAAVLAYSKMGIIDESGQVQRLLKVSHRAGSGDAAERFGEFTELYSILEPGYGLIRTEVLRKTRLLPPHPGNDRLLLAELALHGRFVQVPEYLFMRRDHGQRSVKVYPRIRERYAWVAPSYAGRRMFPHWAYLRGYASAIRRAPITLREKLRCGTVLLKWIRHNAGDLVDDFRP